jgi:hypothetical protein
VTLDLPGRLLFAATFGYLVDLGPSDLAGALRTRFSDGVFPSVRLSFWTSPSRVSPDTSARPFPAEVFLFGDWEPEAAGLPSNDPEIDGLLLELRNSASASRAAGTISKYAGPWRRFKAWCVQKGVAYLPAPPLVVALYFTLLLLAAKSPSSVLSCSAAIFLHHSIAGLPSPTQHPLVAMAREIAKRSRVAGQNVKKPLLASHVRSLFELWLYAPSGNLHSVLKLTAICLCYAGFLRFSDLMTVQWQEIRFLPTHMELFMEKSKTDQYWAGSWVLISRVGGLYCPVALVEFLLAIGEYAAHGPGGLIRSTTISLSRQSLCSEQPVYSTVLSWFKKGVRGWDSTLLSMALIRGDAAARRARQTWMSLTDSSRSTVAGGQSEPRMATWSASCRHVSQLRLISVCSQASL